MGLSNVYGVPGLVEARDAMLLDGTVAAAALKARVTAGLQQLAREGVQQPVLATILAGDDAASKTYVAAKHRACAEVGIGSIQHRFDATTSEERLAEYIVSLNEDEAVSGILLQLPLPTGLDARRLIELIDPRKDVDGLTAVNIGRLGQRSGGLAPCTPRGILALLDHYEVELEGRRAVVVGRSDLVGRPVAMLLSQRDATVTVCHSRTRELAAECRSADVLIAAAGRPGLVGRDHVRAGAVVVDVGIHRTAHGLVGDVDFQEVRRRAGALSPVPGGVGPMTIASLLDNTLAAARSIAARDGLAITT